MTICNEQKLIRQADYAKRLRPLLPDEAFIPDPNKLVVLLINVAILILGWGIASHLDRWSTYLLWLYLPLAVVMGNSVIVLLFSSHELMHGSAIRNSRLIYTFSFIGLAILWMSPTLWKAVHNREHHNKTNSLDDPDRNYLSSQPKTWGKWIQNLFVPSAEVNPITFTVGMATAWLVHNFRNLTSVLLFNSKSVNYVPAAFTISNKERRRIAGEYIVIFAIHFSILAYLEFNLLKIVFAYLIPIGIGYAGSMFYIYTNHMICQMTSVNDPLINSLSVRVPKIFDLLHLNFSYHTEHHIFPGMNSNYYPLVQELLKEYYPERMNLLDVKDAWHLLMRTPRHYQDENNFTDWLGEKSVLCPLIQSDRRA
ncbi:MAG: fatty acid desaturase [Cyanomargarita calcarea GSE-NOS-MK-12-04C]|jgi:fatty acid desaturase|uniref:Fatty acid desaturase n=1 Tax=Cyanomargarita calcarea GSE-NOS-MK-12-04C TaxID=2839659 RepID=A0A951UVN2_9CYAN|nr:fatty acid desaturase [Cyanomargarita calcarea GSE-NOS-MK-12-04C]